LEKATSACSAEARLLLDFADNLLADVRPDALLGGLSTPFDGGIDEALFARANVPGFLLQDFWGERNAFFGRGPQTCLVLDRMAADLTAARHDIESVVVGSARHAAYERIEPIRRRTELRRALGLAEDTTVYSLFGQSLHNLEGYQATVEAWVEAVGPLARSNIAA
jgi:hypothetical protein